MMDQITIERARKVGDELGLDWTVIDINEFHDGINVEMEHGLMDEQTNVTNDNLTMTGKIAWAHLKELPDYYSRLKEMESATSEKKIMRHYYGDTVRSLFMFSAITMAILLPVVKPVLTMPTAVSIIAILLLGIFSGLTNPKQQWVIGFNSAIAIVGFLVFEYYGINAFVDGEEFFFVINQMLALIFLFAIYYNTKTLRVMLKK